MRLLLIAGLCLAATACDRSNQTRLQHDVNAVGHDLAVDTRQAANAPAVKQAGAELKTAGERADAEIKMAAEKTRIEADRAAERAKASVHDATAEHSDN